MSVTFHQANNDFPGDFDFWTVAENETGACIVRCEDDHGSDTLFSVIDGFGCIADAGIPSFDEAVAALRALPQFEDA